MRKILATLLASFSLVPSAQALTMYQQYYVPALTSGTDQSAELTTLPVTYIVNSEVNSYEAVLFPNYVHTIVSGEGKEVLNINPASKMHLAIIQKGDVLNPANDCNLVLDISNMTPVDKKDADNIRAANKSPGISDAAITVSILEQVVLAIVNNLEATRQEYPNSSHTIKSCAFSVQGLDKKPEIKNAIGAGSPLLKTKL